MSLISFIKENLFVTRCQKSATVINGLYAFHSLKNVASFFKMSPFLAATLEKDHFQNASFSKLSVFISVFHKLNFHARQKENRTKTDKFPPFSMKTEQSMKTDQYERGLKWHENETSCLPLEYLYLPQRQQK